MLQLTHSLALANLAALAGSGGALNGKKLVLFTSAPSPTPNRVLADFVEATFDGYARVAITWGTPFVPPAGVPKMDSNLATFICTGTTTPETIVAWGLITDNTSPTPDVLVMSDFLPEPIPMVAIDDGFAMTLSYGQDTVQVGGANLN